VVTRKSMLRSCESPLLRWLSLSELSRPFGWMGEASDAPEKKGVKSDLESLQHPVRRLVVVGLTDVLLTVNPGCPSGIKSTPAA